MSDLTEFLLARIAEDEAVAQDALDGRPWADESWQPEVYDDGVRNVAVAYSPARVLAECEAKWAIVDEARRWIERPSGPETSMPERALAFLALPYAEHPDYREEWRA